MTRMDKVRAWWTYCEKNFHQLEHIPSFEDFCEKILPALQTLDTEQETVL